MCGDYTDSESLICKDTAGCLTKNKGYGLGDFKLALRESNDHHHIPENEYWAAVLAYDPKVGWGALCFDHESVHKPGLEKERFLRKVAQRGEFERCEFMDNGWNKDEQ